MGELGLTDDSSMGLLDNGQKGEGSLVMVPPRHARPGGVAWGRRQREVMGK